MTLSVRLAIVSALALAGCTGETDPSKTNIFESISGLATGEFDNQIAEQEAIAASIAAENQQAAAENQRLEARRAGNAATISALRAEIRDVRALISSTRTQLVGEPEKIARLDGLQSQLMAVETSVDQGGSTAALGSELSSIRAAVRALAS